MKASIKKFWWGKTTTQRIKLVEYGFVDQTKFYLFGKRGLCFLTQNNPVTIPDNIEEMTLCQIIAERQVSHSEMTANLPEICNAQFDKFQNEIYPTRF